MTEEEVAGLGELLLNLLHQTSPKSARHLSLADAEAVVSELLADAAAQKWTADQIKQIGVRSMDFRNGVTMDLEPAREMVAMWVGACRGLIQDGPNYSETVMDYLAKPGDRVEMGVKVAESPERYVIIVQRDEPGTMSPHQARQRAEDVIGKVWKWIADVNDGAGYDSGDLGWTLEQSGFPPPPEEDGEGEE
jgi:hypothetical protein